MPGKPTTVLLSIDDSTSSETAFDWYVSNLHKPGNTVHIFFCIEQPSGVGLEGFFQKSNPPVVASPLQTSSDYVHQGSYNRYQHAVNQKKMEAEQIASKYSEKLKNSKITGDVTTKVSTKSIGQEIVDRATEKKADLIIMGTRSLGQAKRTLLGSVSTYVLHHALCNVAICAQTKQSDKPT